MAHGRFPFEPFIKAQAQHLVIKRRAEALKQGGHQAEVAPAVEVLEGFWGEVELKGPRVAIGAGDGLLGEPDVSALLRNLPALGGQRCGKRGRLRMLADDVEIAAGAVEPDGDRAHQRQVAALRCQRIPHPGREQGMGRALARVAVGQVVETAPVDGAGLRRWKNCGRGRSQFISQKAEITRQGSPW